MPNGYQTIIGIDANDFLTPNIKQYILIARELIKDPKIILLDESNINIDLETELVLRHIINLKKGKKWAKKFPVGSRNLRLVRQMGRGCYPARFGSEGLQMRGDKPTLFSVGRGTGRASR